MRREKELVELLENEKIAIMFLVETDTESIKEPIKFMVTRNEENATQREVRNSTRKDMIEGGRIKIAQECCTRDTGRIRNQAPRGIKDSVTLNEAKKKIRDYCKTLPL